MKITVEKRTFVLDIKPDEFELEVQCPICVLGFMPSGAKCSCCDGTGMVNTPMGDHILSFVCNKAAAWRKENLPPPAAK